MYPDTSLQRAKNLRVSTAGSRHVFDYIPTYAAALVACVSYHWLLKEGPAADFLLIFIILIISRVAARDSQKAADRQFAALANRLKSLEQNNT